MAVTAVSPGFTAFRVNGDPSPSPLTAKCIFRELDDASLQTQTRIWLGEVLQTRLDEESNIRDILADGELLCEVAEVLSKMLPASAAEASHIKPNEIKTHGSSKSTRRYMPYYNVGTFLQLCKDLGLNDIDLFTPSDVVEKRDTRKVCTCIRSFSKKIRSTEINVPDFDSVVCTSAMPTDKVEGIRKSLEQSQGSSSLTTPNGSMKSRAKTSNQPSDYCDEAESRHIDIESNQPSDYPGSELTGDDNSLSELQLHTGELENEDNRLCEYLSPSVPESAGSLSSVCFSDQDLNTDTSSHFQASHFSGMNHKTQNERQNGVINHVPFYWGDFPSDDEFPDHTTDIDETGVLSHDKDISDTASCDSCPVIRENKTYYAGIEHLSCPDIGCETSSCPSLERTHHWTNLVSIGERDSYVCDECFDETSPCSMNGNLHSDDIEHKITHHVSGHGENLDHYFDDSNYVPQASNEATNASNEAFDVEMLTSYPKEECNDGNAVGVDARHTIDLREMNLNSFDTITTKGKEKWSDEGSQNTLEVFEDHNIEGKNIDDKLANVEDILSVNSSPTILHSPEPEVGRVENVEETGHKRHQFADNIEDVSYDKGIDKEMPQSKPHMTVLKSVAKGTALVGAAVFLLHLRWKNNKVHIPKAKKEPIQVPKKSTQKLPSQNTKKIGNSSSVYPAQKLRFGR